MCNELDVVRRVEIDRGRRNWFIIDGLSLTWDEVLGDSCGQVLKFVFIFLHGAESAGEEVVILLSL